MGRWTALLVLTLGLTVGAETVRVNDHEVAFQMKDGRMLVHQSDLAPALPDLDAGDHTYDLLDILKRHPDLRATKRDGKVISVRYYSRQKAAEYRQAAPMAERPRKRQVRYHTKRTKARKTSWRNESAFAKGDYRPSVKTGGGRITNQRGQIVSSSSQDKREGKFASQKEYEMSTHKTGRHTRPGVIYINGWYKGNHYYVSGKDEGRKPSKNRLARQTHRKVNVREVSPIVDKDVPEAERYYIPVEELEDDPIINL